MALEPLNSLSPESDMTSTNLPVPVPSTDALIRRTQTTLELLQEVVQESSAAYWYGRGKASMGREEWEEAMNAFEQCLRLNSNHWRSILQIAVATTKQNKLRDDNNLYKSISQQIVLAFEKQAEDGLEWLHSANELTKKQWLAIQHLIDGNPIALPGLLLAQFAAYNEDYVRQYQPGERHLMHTAIYRTIETANLCYEQLRNILGDYSSEHNMGVLYRLAAFFLNETQWPPYDIKVIKKIIRNYECCIELRYNHASIYYERGRLRGICGEYERSLSDFEAAIKINKDFSTAYKERAFVKAILKHDDTLTAYKLAIEHNPNDYRVWEKRCEFLQYLGNYEDALFDINQVIRLEPDNYFYYYSRSKIKHESQDYNGSLSDFNYFIISLQQDGNEESDYAFYLRERSQIKLKLRDFVGAIADLDSYIKHDENSDKFSFLYEERAYVKAQIGDKVGSDSDYEKARYIDKFGRL